MPPQPSFAVIAAPHYDVKIGLASKCTRMTPPVQPHRHDYELVMTFTNDGKSRIGDWGYELEFPTPMLLPHVVYGGRVANRSDAERTLIRVDPVSEPLRAGDTATLRFQYFVDNELHIRNVESHGAFYAQLVKLRMYVGGTDVKAAERPMDDFVNF